jgi:hypothetical protein
MSDIVSTSQYKTKAQTFIAKRGALVMKEFSPIGALNGLYGSQFEVDALIFSIMKGQQMERTYGIKITLRTTDDGYTREQSCLVDQDELPELINGMAFLAEKLDRLRHGVPNYTELSYLTKDDFKIGFYVNTGPEPDPTIFCSAGGSENAFMKPARFPRLRELIETGMNYLNGVSESMPVD